MRVFAPLYAILLALAGAFAVMVYVKAYGGAFTGAIILEVADEVFVPFYNLNSIQYPIPDLPGVPQEVEELLARLKVFKEDEFADLLHQCHNVIPIFNSWKKVVSE